MTRRSVLSAASAAITLFGLLAAGVAPVAAASASGGASVSGAASANGAVHSKRVCAVAPAGYAACDAHVVTDANLNPLATTTSPSGFFPDQLRAAYGLGLGTPPLGSDGKPPTVAIVDAYANPNAASDLAVYRAQFRLPSLASNGGNVTLTQVSQSGGLISSVSADVGWGQEEMLDLEMVSAICPTCNILYVGANSASFNDLAAAVDTAASQGAKVISNSYGGSEFSGEVTIATHYNWPGVAITVSSGDSGYGAQAPAAFNTVTAVGGTTLKLNSNGTRATETVWSGAGSGCSAYIAKPGWQKDPACSRRTIADVAAVADPATGVAVYDSYGSAGGAYWFVFGGTSVAAPIIGAVYALSGNTTGSATVAPLGVPAILAYTQSSSLFDVASGSNGRCFNKRNSSAAYLCTGGFGYDGPTGNGTPNGTGAF